MSGASQAATPAMTDPTITQEGARYAAATTGSANTLMHASTVWSPSKTSNQMVAP